MEKLGPIFVPPFVASSILFFCLARYHWRNRLVHRLNGAVGALMCVMAGTAYRSLGVTDRQNLDRDLGLIFQALDTAIEQAGIAYSLPPFPGIDGRPDPGALSRLLETMTGDGKPMAAKQIASDAAHETATGIMEEIGSTIPEESRTAAFKAIYERCTLACEAAIILRASQAPSSRN